MAATGNSGARRWVGLALAAGLCLPWPARATGPDGLPSLLERSPQYRGLARRYDIVAAVEADVSGDALPEYVVAFKPNRAERRRGGFAVIRFFGGHWQLAWAGLYARSHPESLTVVGGELHATVRGPRGVAQVVLEHGKDFWFSDEKQSPFNGLTVRVSSAVRAARSKLVPANLVDGDPATVWRTNTVGTGVGEWIQVDFKGPVDLALVGVIGGDFRSKKQWQDSNRLFRYDLVAETEADRSTQVENLDLTAMLKLPTLGKRVTAVAKDVRRTKWSEVVGRDVVSLKLEAASVFLGEQNNSLYVSEIELGQLLPDPGAGSQSARHQVDPGLASGH